MSTIQIFNVRKVWRGIYEVTWTDALNKPRRIKTLYREIAGRWMSGELHPTGVYGDCLRVAPPFVACVLNNFCEAETLTLLASENKKAAPATDASKHTQGSVPKTRGTAE